MVVPVHKNPNSDLTIFVDPSWLIPSEKYLISHALESVLTQLGSDHITNQKINDFVGGFTGVYQLTEYDVDNFCTRLKQTSSQEDTTKLIEFVGLHNTVANRASHNFHEIINCLHRSFAFKPEALNTSLYNELLCTGIEYAVTNIKRTKPIIMITGSPAQAKRQRIVELAMRKKVKIHILFATDTKTPKQHVQFYKEVTQKLDSQFFELRRSFITEMQLEQIFRSIIAPTNLTAFKRKPPEDDLYQYSIN